MAIDFTSANSSPVRHLTTSFAGLNIAASQDFSILVFARFDPGSGSFWYFLSTGPASGSNINMWRQGDGNGRLSALIGGAVTEVSLGPDQVINAGEWFLAIFSRSGGVTTARLCKMGSGRVDAFITTSNSAAYSASAGTLLLGCRQDLDNLREWHGQMSDVIICHDYAITDAEAIAAASGAVLEELPFWNYRKFHADMDFNPVFATGLTDLVGGRTITRNNSGWGAKTDEPPLLRRYSQQRNSKFFLIKNTGGGSIQLSVDALHQAAFVDDLDLTQSNILAAADIAQSQSVESTDLWQGYTLSVSEINQSQFLDNVALMQSGALSVDSLDQIQSIDTPTLTQSHMLSGSNLTQSQVVDNVALSSGTIIAAQSLGHAQLIDNIDLIQSHILQIADIDQAQTVDHIALAAGVLLAVAGISQLQFADNVILMQSGALSISDLSSGQTVDSPALTQAHTLFVDDATQQQFIDGIALSMSVVIAPGDLMQNQFVDGIVLTTAQLLAVQDILQSQNIGSLELIQGSVLVVADLSQNQSIDHVSWIVVVTPDKRIYAINAENRVYSIH